MRARLHSKLIAAMLAPVLLASSAAPVSLVRCGPVLRMSCCCPAEAPGQTSSALTESPRQPCSILAVRSIPAQDLRAAPTVSTPKLVAVGGPFASVWQPLVEPARVRRVELPPGTSVVLANCSLLI